LSVRTTEILVIGGGPAGLSAAIEAATLGAQVTVVDSDLKLGGQLIKQTHKFFGSKDEYAGTRGYKIADILFDDLRKNADRIEILSDCTATGYYPEDGIVTCMIGEEKYFRIRPKKIVVATGAQERLIPFPGNDLPGVYGAGAVQPLMNVYGVTPGDRVLMVGAGNIGLIVSYQLLQAGVQVCGVVEFMPKVGGYWVHAAKIRRLGVPIYLQHTIVEALGERTVSGAVIENLAPACSPGGKRTTIDCDIICMAVGLAPTCELLWQAGCAMKFIPQLCGHVALRDPSMRTSHPDIWIAGDAAGIEEASSAMVEGRIAGLGAAGACGHGTPEERKERFAHYSERLADLRAGEVGEKIRIGVSAACVQKWEE
jgi:sarcosine oxidase subunit alpha